MIRKLTNIAELDGLVQSFGENFFKEGKIPGNFSESHFKKSWTNYLTLGIGALWILEQDQRIVGGMGALLYPDPYSGDVIAAESFWFVHKEQRKGLGGIRLLQEFEKWAKQVGACRLLMAHLKDSMPEKLRAFYGYRGYNERETIYTKEI